MKYPLCGVFSPHNAHSACMYALPTAIVDGWDLQKSHFEVVFYLVLYVLKLSLLLVSSYSQAA